jgi:hypothetical protein
MIIKINFKGKVYGHPTHQPGTVAPTGQRGTFHACGTPSEVFAAYARWERSPVVSTRGYSYPGRYLTGRRIISAVAEQVAAARGVRYGDVVGEMSRLARDAGVAGA